MRLFVCGDVHGSLMALKEAMQRVGFDKSQDRLWVVGDLVDRGPNSLEVLQLLKKPWFNSILGNHEEMIVRGFAGEGDMALCSLQNGGGWFLGLSETQQAEAVALMAALPVVNTLISPSGRKIGLVHGEPPTDDWDQIVVGIETVPFRQVALWGRNVVRGRRRLPEGGIRNVDHVYCGHTPLDETKTVENVSWIDTGACFSDGKLTMVEVL